MKKLLLLVIVSTTALFAQPKTNIAVTDLPGQGVDQASAQIISDRLRNELFKTGSCTVLERGAMQDILKEQGFQQSGCTSDQCMVEIGQMLGVTHLVAGIVGKIGNMYTISVRLIDIKSGKIMYTDNVDCKCQIEDVLTGSVTAIAKKIAQSISPAAASGPALSQQSPFPKTGFLKVETKPDGAQVLLNDSLKGSTPYKSEKINVGEYRLKLDLSGFKPIEETVVIVADKTVGKTYKLEHTQQWQDSVEALNKAAKAVSPPEEKSVRKRSVALKITFGVAAAGAAVAGIIFDSVAKSNIDNDASIKAEYVALNDPSRANEYQQRLDDNLNTAKTMQMVRNVCYGLAGASVVGFGISFAF
jgi:TolB-like protein